MFLGLQIKREKTKILPFEWWCDSGAVGLADSSFFASGSVSIRLACSGCVRRWFVCGFDSACCLSD